MANAIYDILKSMIDPAGILFILLCISLIFGLKAAKKKTELLFLFLIIVLFYGFSIQPVASFFSSKLENKYMNIKELERDKTLDVIVVLGGGTYTVRGGTQIFPSDDTSARLAQAIRMYQKYNAKFLVCSGKGDQKISEAELMADMAEDFGVPRARIRPEAKSENTYQHAVEFDKMFLDKNIHVGLVTSAYHMKRSETEFRKYFKNIHPLPSGYLTRLPTRTAVIRYLPQSHWLFSNAMIFKEHLGRLWYWMKDL